MLCTSSESINIHLCMYIESTVQLFFTAIFEVHRNGLGQFLQRNYRKMTMEPQYDWVISKSVL